MGTLELNVRWAATTHGAFAYGSDEEGEDLIQFIFDRLSLAFNVLFGELSFFGLLLFLFSFPFKIMCPAERTGTVLFLIAFFTHAHITTLPHLQL